MSTIEGATVIKTGFTRGSGYDKIYLRKVDGEIIILEVESNSNDGTYVGVRSLINSYNKRIEKCKEEINQCKKLIRNIEKW